MMNTKKQIRPFNQDAYDACDSKPKVLLNEIMQKKGYKLLYGLNQDDKEKYDMIFEKDGERLIFENEVREVFDIIRDKYKTVHIPYRKRESIANFYVVWKKTYDEFILIPFEEIKRGKLVKIKCKEPNKNIVYEEVMVDVQKNKCQFFKKINNTWKINKI